MSRQMIPANPYTEREKRERGSDMVWRCGSKTEVAVLVFLYESPVDNGGITSLSLLVCTVTVSKRARTCGALSYTFSLPLALSSASLSVGKGKGGLHSFASGLVFSTLNADEIEGVGSIVSATAMGFHRQVENLYQFEANEPEILGSEMSGLIKSQIANHPLYPSLVSAYIGCRQVGAPQQMASILEDIAREYHPSGGSSEFGVDPELDEFMESYCEILYRYKEELSKPFDEARTFLSNIETQLSDLCKVASSSTTAAITITSGNYHSDEAPGTSEEDLSCGEAEALDSMKSSGPHPGDKELKEMLLQKYSGYLSSLRKEFLKKRKKVKLPKDARMALSNWWNNHYRWPYPTEEEKKMLSEVTGLDQKQISNWFINQRKRHWKPSEDMRFALMEGISSGGAVPQMYLSTEGTGNEDR